jgi:hypothetical protein
MEVSDLKSRLDHLEETQGKLCELILKDEFDSRSIQTLSYGYGGFDGFVPPAITGAYADKEAAEKACSIIKGYYRTDGQPVLSVHRSPGMIRVSQACYPVVEDINVQKDSIKAILTSMPRRLKNSVIKNLAPGIVLKELYRHVHIVENPHKINLSWVVSGSSAQKAPVADVVETIKFKIEMEKLKNKDTFYLEEDLKTVQSFGSTHVFKIMRKTQPYLKYNVKFKNQLSWQNIPAHLPLLFTLKDQAPPSTKLLTSIDCIRVFDRKESHKQDHLISWLGLLK